MNLIELIDRVYEQNERQSIDELVKRVRAILRQELLRRGLLQRAPRTLGLDVGDRIGSPEALDELAWNALTKVVLPNSGRFRASAEQDPEGSVAEAKLVTSLRNWIHALYLRHDDGHVWAYRIVAAAVRAALVSGDLDSVDGATPHGGSILRLSGTSPEATPTSIEALAAALRGSPFFGEFVAALQARASTEACWVSTLFTALRAGGCTCFHLRALLSAVQSEATARLRARREYLDTTSTDSAVSTATARQFVLALHGAVVGHPHFSEAQKQRLHRLLVVLERQVAEGGDSSVRALAVLLHLPRSTVGDDLKRLRELAVALESQ